MATPTYKIQVLATVDEDVPKGFECVAYLWFSLGRKWDRYSVCYAASTARQARANAQAGLDAILSKVEHNKAADGKGRRYAFDNATAFFDALVDLNLSLEANTQALLADSDCMDQQGSRLRDMHEVVTYQVDYDDPETDEPKSVVIAVHALYTPVYRHPMSLAKERAFELAATLKDVEITELGRDWIVNLPEYHDVSDL